MDAGADDLSTLRITSQDELGVGAGCESVFYSEIEIFHADVNTVGVFAGAPIQIEKCAENYGKIVNADGGIVQIVNSVVKIFEICRKRFFQGGFEGEIVFVGVSGSAGTACKDRDDVVTDLGGGSVCWNEV